MAQLPNIVMLTGGADYHPSRAQAQLMLPWMADFARLHIHDGAQALDHLRDADLLILGGSFPSDFDAPAPSHGQRQALVDWRKQGRPLLVHHGFAVSWHTVWPQLLDLAGVQWVEGKTWHPEIGPVELTVDTGHPLAAGLPDKFSQRDEIYMDLNWSKSFAPTPFMSTQWEGKGVDLAWSTLQGPGGFPQAPWAYVALGHDEEAINNECMRRLWVNLTRWALGLDKD